jgi:hypothetical protein
MDRLLRGAGIFVDYDPFLIESEEDSFLLSWKRQNADLVQEINQHHPLDPTQPEYYEGTASYFQDNDPSRHSSFIYDSMMLVGMAACQLEAKKQKNETLPEDIGGAHLGEMFLTDFDGASGVFRFNGEDEDTANSRDPTGLRFGMFNVRAAAGLDGKNRQVEETVTWTFPILLSGSH